MIQLWKTIGELGEGTFGVVRKVGNDGCVRSLEHRGVAGVEL
jgi:hypothetical protein